MGNITTVNKRLFFTLLCSLILHVMMILSISVKVSAPFPPQTPPVVELELTLVNTHTFTTVKQQTKILAQAEQPSPESSPNESISNISQPTIKQTEKHQIKPQLKSVKTITTKNLILPNLSEIAILDQHYLNSTEALNNKPKKRQISASTKGYATAAYMKAWEIKIERIGNFNYPQEARRQQIYGSLMLMVNIHPDGSVPPDGIILSRSSGYPILDNAAKRIIRLAAPYPAVPEDVLQGNDILTILRTWKFEAQ